MDMKLFVNIYNDAKLLGHFLDHYTRAGITQFFIAAGPAFTDAVNQYKSAYNITLFQDLDVAESLFGTSSISIMRNDYQDIDEWVVIVDLDEFVEFTDNIYTIIANAEKTGATVVRGIMYDRFSADGRLADFKPDSELSSIFPVKSQFILTVMGGCDHKGVLVRGHLASAVRALHHRFEGERLSAQLLAISHYKWFTGAIARLRVNYRIMLEAGSPWAIEYKRALDHYDKHGRFVWEEFGGKLAEDFEVEPPKHCSDCSGAISEAEFAYSMTHFGKPLCRTDQRHPHSSDG
jgi:hypothetical protein